WQADPVALGEADPRPVLENAHQHADARPGDGARRMGATPAVAAVPTAGTARATWKAGAARHAGSARSTGQAGATRSARATRSAGPAPQQPTEPRQFHRDIISADRQAERRAATTQQAGADI